MHVTFCFEPRNVVGVHLVCLQEKYMQVCIELEREREREGRGENGGRERERHR